MQRVANIRNIVLKYGFFLFTAASNDKARLRPVVVLMSKPEYKLKD